MMNNLFHFRNTCSRKKTKEETNKDEEKNKSSKLEIHFISFTTLYYFVSIQPVSKHFKTEIRCVIVVNE